MSKTLVTSYSFPDLDGTSCAVAYAEFLRLQGQNAEAAFFGELHDESRYLLDTYKISYPKMLQNDEDYEQVILVDASELTGIDDKVQPDKVVEIIDHRKVNDAHLFTNAKVQIEMVGAAATLIAEKFHEQSTEPSKASAVLLAGGIVSNSFNFRSPNTTDRDKKMYEWLKGLVGLKDDFTQKLFQAKSDVSGEKLWKRMDGEFAIFDMASKKVGIAQLELFGAEEVARNRMDEIVKNLETLKAREELDLIMFSIVELGESKNFFVVSDLEMQKILTKTLGVEFANNLAERPGFIMRKQIAPFIKTELEAGL